MNLGFYVVMTIHHPNAMEEVFCYAMWYEVAEKYQLDFEEHVKIDKEIYSPSMPGYYLIIKISKILLSELNLKPSYEPGVKLLLELSKN